MESSKHTQIFDGQYYLKGSITAPVSDIVYCELEQERKFRPY